MHEIKTYCLLCIVQQAIQSFHFRVGLLKLLDQIEKSGKLYRVKTVGASMTLKEAVFSNHVDIKIRPAHNDADIKPPDPSLTFVRHCVALKTHRITTLVIFFIFAYLT